MAAIKKQIHWAGALLCGFVLSGCDHIYGLLEIPDPVEEKKLQTGEGKAIGSACRYSGRSLEDCYILNPDNSKTSIFAGWREMNDYMLENNIETVASTLVPMAPSAPAEAAAANHAAAPSLTAGDVPAASAPAAPPAATDDKANNDNNDNNDNAETP